MATLRHAVTRVPFYRQLGIAPGDIRSSEDLALFPVLTKADVQDQNEALLAEGFDRRRLQSSRSSGMTGEPALTYFDDRAWALCKYALKIRRVLADTHGLGQRVLLVSEQTVPRSSGWGRMLSMPVLALRHMSLSDDLCANVRELVAFRPTIIYGFPSYLLALADAARVAGVELPRVPLVYTSSEVLTDPARAALAVAFRGRVVDVYGSTEFKEIAVQCEHGGYHVNFESVYVESHAECEPRLKRLLVTTLLNRAMPLIRYELGDTGQLEETDCACGRRSARIAALNGRIGEVLSFPDGTKVSGYLLTTAVERQPTVKHYRIVHESPWSLRIETLARPPLAAAERQALEADLRRALPAAAALRFVQLENRGPYTKRLAVAREF